ncbi:hypothetical protein C4D60_Mb04t24210 [Musa balbisiana]|uniref:D-isomer specific 2-hydroxyacid dehydrogenase NAD-binding domain-containing protein n=1 Tax=Musa balbisiana TaxID=52838 RepID=A0A4S8KE99_MUSBA|nr:hypothetical protein C4D60_Mb04t24210 [Musa balbisiana]
MHYRGMGRSPSDPNRMAADLPLVVSLNRLEDPSLEREALAGAAVAEHVGLSGLAGGPIESAAAVLLHSLVLLPRAAQRRLRPWQLILCLGSPDRAVNSALASDLGLRLVHVDANRAPEVADTVMALFLGILRRTLLLSRHSSSLSAASGWLGSIHPLCRGMRRCRGLVLGIIGKSASARCLATRSLTFKMSVLCFDLHGEAKGKSRCSPIAFPAAARRMDTLNDLLAASDLVSLHCTLSDDTMQIPNAECLQHVKPGAFIVNTGSGQLIDDCALKQLLIDDAIAGCAKCALHGAEGPQWMEAWTKGGGGGWIFDTITNVTKRDPAAQFAVAFKSKLINCYSSRTYMDCGLLLLVVNCCRLTEKWNSYLQVWEKNGIHINRKMVSMCGRAGGWRVQFWTNASLSIAETHWLYQYCLSCQNRTQKTVLDTYLLMFSCAQTAMCNQQRFCVLFYNNAVLDVSIEILAALNEDGVTRCLD